MEDFKASPEDIARLLYYLKEIESSGGANTRHPTIASGMHAGESAKGVYAIMPKTKEDMLKKYKDLSEDSSDEDIAKKMAEEVLNKAGGDEALAATMWEWGHNTPSENFDNLRDKDRYQKYNNLRKQIPQALDANPYLYPNKNSDLINVSPQPEIFDKLKYLMRKGK